MLIAINISQKYLSKKGLKFFLFFFLREKTYFLGNKQSIVRLKRRVYEKVFNEVLPAAVINTPGTCSSQLSLAAVFARRAQPIYTYMYLLFSFNQLQTPHIVVTTLLSLAGDMILMNRPRACNHRARNSPRCVARARVSVLRHGTT